MYESLKIAHIACALATAAMFTTRGVLMIRGAAALEHKALRITPHAIDTLLLATALGLVFASGLNPFTTPWLATKLVVLVLYIAAGFVAMRFGPTRRVRVGAWLMALVLLGYLFAVALTKRPMPL